MKDARESRQLGFWMCLALVVGTFIGSGIFLLPAQLAPFGWNAFLGWLVTISGALCLAYLFGRLAKALPLAGGPYAYVGEAFGPLPAFVVAWSYWVSLWAGNAAIAVAAVSYLSLFAPGLAGGLAPVAAIGILWALTALNCVSVQAGGRFQMLTVAIKLVPLLAVIIIAAYVVGTDQPTATVPFETAEISLTSVNAAAALTLWALLGFEAASIASRNVIDPARNVPRATIIGTLIVGALYLLVATPVTMFLPQDQVSASNAPFALFVGHYWTPGIGSLIGLFAAVSAMGALNGLILIQGELPLAMARDGTFPAWFSKTAANGIALRAQLVSTSLATVLVAANYSRSMSGLFAFMALLSTAAALVLYLACALAAGRLQLQGRLGGPWVVVPIALIASLYALWTLYGAGQEPLQWGALLLIVGIPVYFTMRLNSLWSSPAGEAAPAAPPE
ncbi:MAG TPA: amino acid permease [Sphingomicrobium sp.]|nr:amino acid permease [Sphingomicrobium sp.]